jgi:hypothetical protein
MFTSREEFNHSWRVLGHHEGPQDVTDSHLRLLLLEPSPRTCGSNTMARFFLHYRDGKLHNHFTIISTNENLARASSQNPCRTCQGNNSQGWWHIVNKISHLKQNQLVLNPFLSHVFLWMQFFFHKPKTAMYFEPYIRFWILLGHLLWFDEIKRFFFKFEN